MSDGPFRERRVSAKAARAILQRAIELDAAADAEPITFDEIARLAARVGVSEDAVARAAEGAASDGQSELPRAHLGIPRRVVFEERLPFEIDERAVEDVVAAVQFELGTRGKLQALGGTTTWLVAPGQGDNRAITVDIRRRDGETLVRVEERMMPLLASMYVFAALPASMLFLVFSIALAEGAGLTALPLCFLLPLVLMVVRKWHAAKARKRTQQLRRLTAQLRSIGERTEPAEVRIATELGTDADPEQEVLGAGAEAVRGRAVVR